MHVATVLHSIQTESQALCVRPVEAAVKHEQYILKLSVEYLSMIRVD